MTIDALGHQFTTVVTYGDGGDDKPVKQVDTHQSIKKPLYYVRFNTHLPDDAVKLAYAAVDDIEADDNVVIIDRSAAAPENSPEFVVGEESFNDDTFSSFYESILITDVYTPNIPSQPLKPLFYRHELPGDVDTDTIYILDTSFAKINTNVFSIVEQLEYDDFGVATGDNEYVGVYNDLKNSFDDDTGELVAYYVQYVDASGVTHTELLNNEPAYREATFDDINWNTLNLKTWAKAYLINQVGNHYEFTLPTETNYTVRYEESIRLKAEKPVTDTKDLPWFVRVTNGAFTHSVGTSVFQYHVAEFGNQQFNPIEPYKFILSEEVDKVGQGLVQLKHTPLAVSDLTLDIVIADRDDTVLYALTTNALKTGTAHYQEGTASGVNWNSTKILSYDSISGLVQLDVTLKDYYNITASYYYTEKYLEFTLLNLNPLTNPDVLENFYVLYLVPETSANAGVETTVHYLRVGRDGLVKDCSQTDISSDVIGLPYGRPIIATTGGTSTQDSTTTTATGVLGHEFFVGAQYDFLREYTLEAPAGYPGQDYPNRYLVLAEISVVHQTSVGDTVILDNRQRGGGIKEDYDSEAKELNPEVAWYGDIGLGNGVPYPGNSVAIVRLPHCLLDEYGGSFTRTEIREVVKRHLPFGHYPVIDYYGIVPDVYVADVSAEEELTISWPSEGSDVTYNIYYSTGSRYTKHNSSPVADNASGNTYTIQSLTPGVIYYIYVRAITDNPCACPRIPETVCDGDIQYIGCGGDGWDEHEGPPSVVIKMKPLEVVPLDGSDALGHQFAVVIP